MPAAAAAASSSPQSFSLTPHTEKTVKKSDVHAAPKSTEPPPAAWLHEQSFREEMQFFAMKAESARLSNVDADWRSNNSDFDYCALHNRITEISQLHPKGEYHPDCQRCHLKGYMTAFFHKPENNIESITDAMTNWEAFDKQRSKMAEKGRQHDAGKYKAELMEYDRRERAAWMRYTIVAWLLNCERLNAMRNQKKNPAAFNMLPANPNEDLVTYANHWQKRFGGTGAGITGRKCNSIRCDVHEDNPRAGHFIQTLPKHRYLECGICFIQRGDSEAQRAADAFSESSRELRPQYSFADTRKGRSASAMEA